MFRRTGGWLETNAEREEPALPTRARAVARLASEGLAIDDCPPRGLKALESRQDLLVPLEWSPGTPFGSAIVLRTEINQALIKPVEDI